MVTKAETEITVKETQLRLGPEICTLFWSIAIKGEGETLVALGSEPGFRGTWLRAWL